MWGMCVKVVVCPHVSFREFRLERRRGVPKCMWTRLHRLNDDTTVVLQVNGGEPQCISILLYRSHHKVAIVL